MTQHYPLPLTAAMLAKANIHEGKPRYTSMTDWHGGQFGNEVDQAEATQAIANRHSANVEIDYDPQHQKAKSNDMVPPLTILEDLGKDYGFYSGATGRAGTIQPRQPYPAGGDGGGGGGGAPEWVPVNAKIAIDFINDRAWTEADGEVAIDTLLGSDPNTVNGWGESSYDEANLSENGYSGSDPALLGSTRSFVLAGATVVVRSAHLSSVNDGINFVAPTADGNDATEIDVDLRTTRNWLKQSTWSGGQQLFNNIVNLGINCLALTVTSTRLESSVNGCAAITGTDTDYLARDAVVFSNKWGSTAFQTITIYDALPSTTGLSVLSETGVTNTAPHDFTYTNQIDAGYVSGAREWTFTAANIAGFSGGPVGFATTAAIDDEGNPLVITLSDNDGGKFFLSLASDLLTPVSSGPPATTYVNADTSAGKVHDPGIYQCTLRATDPGGLYVEQEFTITVTS